VTRKDAISKQIVATMSRAEKAFRHGGIVYLPKVVVECVENCWQALLCDRDPERAEHLLQVTEFLIARNRTKFAADPAKYIARQQELAV
jgi:hypothetical protein